MGSGRTLSCRMAPEYLGSVPGILKIVELVLSIIAFGLACDVATNSWHPDHRHGFGWVSFVAIAGFVMALVCLAVHLLMSADWTWPRIVELGLYALWTICFMIAGIVAAAYHGENGSWEHYPEYNPHRDRVAAAAAAFSFFCMVVWAVDTAMQAMNIRVTVTTQTTTTTTTTNVNTDVPQRYEGNPQY